MRDYREKTVHGMIADIKQPFPRLCDVTVRMTSDDRGKSLSLQAANILIEIPLEPVDDIVEVVRK